MKIVTGAIIYFDNQAEKDAFDKDTARGAITKLTQDVKKAVGKLPPKWRNSNVSGELRFAEQFLDDQIIEGEVKH